MQEASNVTLEPIMYGLILLIVQLLLCFKVKIIFVKLIPIILFIGSSFVYGFLTVAETTVWGRYIFYRYLIISLIALFICVVGWIIWIVWVSIKRRRK